MIAVVTDAGDADGGVDCVLTLPHHWPLAREPVPRRLRRHRH
jgi:hypothetical protein